MWTLYCETSDETTRAEYSFLSGLEAIESGGVLSFSLVFREELNNKSSRPVDRIRIRKASITSPLFAIVALWMLRSRPSYHTHGIVVVHTYFYIAAPPD